MVLTALKRKCTTIFVSGDMNAALYGGRRGYSGDFNETDEGFQDFVREQQFRECNNKATHTWAPYSGRDQAATLDHILIWSEVEDGDYTVSAWRAPQERHDHLVVTANVSPALLQALQGVQLPVPRKWLQMTKFEEVEYDLNEYLDGQCAARSDDAELDSVM